MTKFTAWTYDHGRIDAIWTPDGLRGGLDNVLTPLQTLQKYNLPSSKYAIREILIQKFKIESELIYFILKIESSRFQKKLKEYTVQFMQCFVNIKLLQKPSNFQGLLKQGSAGRRRPRSPRFLNPSFPSLKSSRTFQFTSTAFVVGEQNSGIQSRSLRTKTRNLENQDGEDIDVQRRQSQITARNSKFLFPGNSVKSLYEKSPTQKLIETSIAKLSNLNRCFKLIGRLMWFFKYI